MIHKNETGSAVSGIAKMLMALGMLFFALGCQKAKAATDDGAFNDCLQVMDQGPDALTADAWRNMPMDPKVLKIVEPLLFGSTVVRWISHKNDNESTTIVVFIRDLGPQAGDDPDGFLVFLQQENHLSLKDQVGANAFSFAKESHNGVNGLLYCTRDQVSGIWTWSGNDWEAPK